MEKNDGDSDLGGGTVGEKMTGTNVELTDNSQVFLAEDGIKTLISAACVVLLVQQTVNISKGEAPRLTRHGDFRIAPN